MNAPVSAGQQAKCSHCGVAYVPGARHWSGCKVNPGGQAIPKDQTGEGFAYHAWIRLIRTGAPLGPIAQTLARIAWYQGRR